MTPPHTMPLNLVLQPNILIEMGALNLSGGAIKVLEDRHRIQPHTQIFYPNISPSKARKNHVQAAIINIMDSAAPFIGTGLAAVGLAYMLRSKPSSNPFPTDVRDIKSNHVV